MRQLAAFLLLTTLALGSTGRAAAQQAEPAPRIVVVGEGRVEAAPDLARFTAGVQSEATRAEEAFAATGAAMRGVFEALAAAGVAPRDVQTSELAVDPLWAEGEGQPRVRGYLASNLVTVRVRDVARLGALIDAAGAAGANRVQSVSFEVAEPGAHLDAARERAVADARARAELLARAAGVTLGRVLSVREVGAEGPVPMFARSEAMMDATPIAEGVIDLTVRVEIVYAID